MPPELRLDTADVLGLRFARSPLWETMEALRVTREPRRQAFHLSWLRRVDPAAVAEAAAVLAPLVPRRGTQPDFLVPIPTGPTATAEEDLATVAATPLEIVERELLRAAESPVASAAVRAGVRALLRDPAAALRRVVAAQRVCWEQLVRPFWPQIDDLLAADIAGRAAQLATSGLEAALTGLSPRITWTGAGLLVASDGFGDATDLRGRGLVVMPSVFVWPSLITVTDPPSQPTVVYPARGMGTLWPPDGAERTPAALRALLGATRATLLLGLDAEASTSALARRLGLGLPTVSAHLGVLRRGGLVVSRRAGREVRHRRTALGAMLCA